MNEPNSPKTDSENQNTWLDLFYEIENSALSRFSKPKSTVIKYTKLPHFGSEVSSSHHNYSPQPRLRRIVTLQDQQIAMNRSLQPNLSKQDIISSPSYPKREINMVTIADDGKVHDYVQHSEDLKKSASRTPKKVRGQSYQDSQMQHSHKIVSQVALSKKDASYNSRDTKKSRIHLSKNITESFNNGKDSLVMKQKLSDDLKCNLSNKPSSIVYSKKYQNNKKKYISPTNKSISLRPYIEKQQKKTNNKYKVLTIQLDTSANKMLIATKNVNVETDTIQRINQTTQHSSDSDMLFFETEIIKEKFDNLDIPNISLIEEKKDSNENKGVNYNNKYVPNLNRQKVDKISVKYDINLPNDSLYNNRSSYIIRGATVTYTTEKKIDFHVVKNEWDDYFFPTLNYPLNIVSIFEKEIGNKKSDKLLDDKKEEKHKANRQTKPLDENIVGCCQQTESNNLLKPSDLMTTISLHNRYIQSDYMREQFQRELNFINSFFESLKYLERFSENCFTDLNIHSWTGSKQFNANNSQCDTDLTKFVYGYNVDDTRTMAMKSLCQLNLLIHNERRRARNFLFVLKMQEDVLKDYIKSQMIWLEKKKKQDNIDISALKKKQRGALLKLQHECGEMQRMRKALFTLSEKRKVALMKTKKNIEMKIKDNFDVEQGLFGKKQIKRKILYDRCLVPLKCFDLSSSGCEESSTSQIKLERAFYSVQTADVALNATTKIVTSAEKSIQTSDSVMEGDLFGETNTSAAENCVVVDGAYLNILFHNLSLPQIFSVGKQYEVNEEALRIIVQSSNTHSGLNDTVAIEKFIVQVKNIEKDDDSTTYSTGHSLVEEFGQYFKSLDDEEKSHSNSPEHETYNYMRKECAVQTNNVTNKVNNEQVCDHLNVTMIAMDDDETMLQRLSSAYGVDRLYECAQSILPVDESELHKETVVANVGPLPVPAGAAAPVEVVQSANAVWVSSESSSNFDDAGDKMVGSNLPPSQFPSPVMYEAEELRRQQLAIEQEIKALEQQQCQLSVVREIPNKPPPPYTPPVLTPTPRPSRQYKSDDSVVTKIRSHFVEHSSGVFDVNDPFEAFVIDFCDERTSRQMTDTSHKPWEDSCLLPEKSQPELKKVIDNVTGELKEMLSGVTRSCVSGISSRRTDHIDDLLFAECKRCEPEWTSLQDVANVKNQLFESIFQKLLNEALHDYKTIVCTDKHSYI